MLTLWGLPAGAMLEFAELASRFHQDFDVEELSFREALEQHVSHQSRDKKAKLREQVTIALQKADSSEEFSRLFVAAGAENWPAHDDARAELVRWLSRNA